MTDDSSYNDNMLSALMTHQSAPPNPVGPMLQALVSGYQAMPSWADQANSIPPVDINNMGASARDPRSQALAMGMVGPTEMKGPGADILPFNKSLRTGPLSTPPPRGSINQLRIRDTPFEGEHLFENENGQVVGGARIDQSDPKNLKINMVRTITPGSHVAGIADNLLKGIGSIDGTLDFAKKTPLVYQGEHYFAHEPERQSVISQLEEWKKNNTPGLPDLDSMGTTSMTQEEFEKGKNSLGPTAMRSLLPEFKRVFPNAETANGIRMSGARAKSNSEGPLNQPLLLLQSK